MNTRGCVLVQVKMNEIVVQLAKWTVEPPLDISRVVDTMKNHKDEDNAVDLGCIILCDWSFYNECIELGCDDEFLSVLYDHYFKNQSRLHNLQVAITLLNNMYVDYSFEIPCLDLLLERVEMCSDINVGHMKNIFTEFIHFIKLYSDTRFNGPVLDFCVKHVVLNINDKHFEDYIRVIKNFCKLNLDKSKIVLDKYNFTSVVAAMCNQGYTYKLLSIVSFLLKRGIKLVLSPAVLESVWRYDDDKYVTIITHSMLLNPGLKESSVFDIFISDILDYPCTNKTKLKFYTAVFQTSDDFEKYSSSHFDNITFFRPRERESKIIYYTLLRRFYDYNPKLFPSYLYMKILLDKYGSRYFCKTLQEKAHAACVQNSISVDRIFITNRKRDGF